MLSRRTALLAALTGSALGRTIALAQPASNAEAPQNAQPVTVLNVHRRSIEVNGKPASVLGITQENGTAGITTDVGRRFRVRVANQLDVPTLIHWHGMTPPWQQDGVPGISAPPIAPGGSADYDFPLSFGGTFWMHSHQGLQEQELLAAPLIIHDRSDRAKQRQVVIMLADFSFTPPEQIYAALRKSSGMANMSPGPTKMAEMSGMSGMAAPSAEPMPAKPDSGSPGMGKQAMGGMAAAGAASAAPDLNDVKYDAFLANDRTLADPEVIRVEPGDTVLLRVINSSSMSAYHFDLGRLRGELVAVDGMPVRPVPGQRFPIAVAQRLDIRVTLPRTPAAYPLLNRLEGERSQSGIVLLAGRAPVTRVPALAPMPSPALTLDLENQLRAAEPLAPRKADRVHQIDLTGAMQGYVWSINGVAWTKETPPLPVAAGERVELVMQNRTPMPHPMHLHGHPVQVVEINGRRFSGAVRDTVLVTPGARVVVAFDANNPGLWAFHCHLLYHLEAGMFATVKYV